MAIYYLDADDEITSAATRIRDSSDSRIALVLTAGSRVATSRINFILLGREARKRNKSLAIVAADPSTQSVARSADLAVYASVNEYERAQSAIANNAAAVAAGGSPAVGATTEALDELARTVPIPSMRRAAGSQSRTSPESSPHSRVPWPAVAGALALAIVLVAGGLFFLYPSASVTVALQEEPIGPLALTVTVDPSAATVDDQTATIPGLAKAFPVEVSGTYIATGQHVDETAATGSVTFSSYNTFFAVPVLAGTQVSTKNGVAFHTTKAVTVPAATVSGTTISYGTVQVGIQAVAAGTAGNVAANTITRLPSDLSAAKVSVTNLAPTTGGTHTVTAEVQQTDIDSAARDLLAKLDGEFKNAMAAPGAHPSGSDLFDDTARMGVAVCSPDPAGLLGKTEDAFDLACTATGTATIADLSNVKSVAERRIKALLAAGYSLVESSVQTELGTPTVKDGTLIVPVTARAAQVRKVTVDQLRNGIVGKSVKDAQAYLKGFGKTSVALSPSWADKMPSFDFRIDVQLVAPSPSPSSSPSPSTSAGESARPATPKPTVRRTPEPTPPVSGPPVAVSPSASGSIQSPSPVATASPPQPSATPNPTLTPTPTPTAAQS